MGCPGVSHALQEIFMLDPEGTEAEGDWAEAILKRQFKKDGLMVGGAVRKDFGRGKNTKGEEGRMD